MKLKVYRNILPLFLLVLLSSCLSVTTVLEHKASGSGTLTLDYRISKKSAGIQKDALGTKNLIPLPVNETDFLEMAASLSGISVRGYEDSEDSNYIYIQADIDYESLDDLGAFLGIPVNYSETGLSKRLVMTFFDSDTELDPESRAILASLFADDKLVFEMRFPSSVRSSTYGGIDGRTVTFETPLADVYEGDGFIWSVEW